MLSNIRCVDLETYRNQLRNIPTDDDKIRANGTINREIFCLHHMFSKGADWEMMEETVFDRGKTLLVKENNKFWQDIYFFY